MKKRAEQVKKGGGVTSDLAKGFETLSTGLSTTSSGWGRRVRGKESKFSDMLKEIDKIDAEFNSGQAKSKTKLR